MVYIVEEHVNLRAKLGVGVRFGSSSSINGSKETLGCEKHDNLINNQIKIDLINQ